MSETDRPIVGLIHGSGHGAWSWDLLRPELEARGFDTIAVDLPADKPGATYGDFAIAAANAFEPAIPDGKKINIVDHSGGAQTVPGLAAILGKEAINTVIHISGSFGESGNHKHVSLLNLWRPNIPQQRRSSEEFRSAILPIEGGLTAFDASQIRRLFFHDCSPARFIWALERIKPHARPKDEPSFWAHMLPGVRQAYILGKEDRIRNREWAVQAAGSLGMKFIEIEGGHSPAISRPDELADIIADFINRDPSLEDTEAIPIGTYGSDTAA